MKNKPLAFSILGAGMLIALVFVINCFISMNHPWFIYPTFAFLWWPISVFFAKNKKYKSFSIVGAIYISGFAYLVNMITSPSFPWYIFIVFAVLWWPIGLILGGTKKPKLFAVVSSLYIVAFFAITNYITSPNYPWFIYPAFALLWWPISLIICSAKKYKLYAVVSVIFISAFFAIVNYTSSPQYIWFYYPIFPLLWWPLSMFLAKKPKVYSIVMLLLAIAYLMLINYMNSPDNIWYPYVAFHLIWWPLVMLLGKQAKSLWFAVLGALTIIGYYVFLYYQLTPQAHPWYLYIVLPAIWWPVSIAFGRRALTIVFQLFSLVAFIIYYSILNIILTPDCFWSISLIYPLLWVAMGIYFGHKKKFFAFSICAAIVTIGYFSILNYITTPNTIWAVYPSFVILWWPLSMYFFKVRKENPHKVSD